MLRNVEQKKEFMHTITRTAESLDFPGKTEFVDMIRAGGEIIKNLQKLTLKKEFMNTTQARGVSRHSGHPKKQITKKY